MNHPTPTPHSIEEKKQYAIVDKEGNFLTVPNETGSGRYIGLMTKKNGELYLKMYTKDCKLKKVKVL